MDTLYRFSPIKDEKTFNAALEYITCELEKLSQKLFDEKLSITILNVFAHYPEEYKYLHTLVSQKGPKAQFSSESSLYVEHSQKIVDYTIEYLGVRIVDPYRMQVGCGDYEVDNFDEFKKKWLGKSDFIRQFSDDMIEIWHPDFDILGYVVPAF